MLKPNLSLDLKLLLAFFNLLLLGFPLISNVLLVLLGSSSELVELLHLLLLEFILSLHAFFLVTKHLNSVLEELKFFFGLLSCLDLSLHVLTFFK